MLKGTYLPLCVIYNKERNLFIRMSKQMVSNGEYLREVVSTVCSYFFVFIL